MASISQPEWYPLWFEQWADSLRKSGAQLREAQVLGRIAVGLGEYSVTFFDAMPLPNKNKLFPDVITVHHEDYYQIGADPPADWDNPNPVPFLSANGRYLIGLAGPEEWVNAAFSILAYSLETVGVGSKQKRLVAQSIVTKIKEAGREKKTRDKAWYKELLDFLE